MNSLHATVQSLLVKTVKHKSNGHIIILCWFSTDLRAQKMFEKAACPNCLVSGLIMITPLAMTADLLQI